MELLLKFFKLIKRGISKMAKIVIECDGNASVDCDCEDLQNQITELSNTVQELTTALADHILEFKEVERRASYTRFRLGIDVPADYETQDN